MVRTVETWSILTSYVKYLFVANDCNIKVGNDNNKGDNWL
jgi:hypothetical protein